MHILGVMLCFWVVAVIYTLKLRYLPYQMSQIAWMVLIVSFGCVTAPAFSMISRYGRFWYWFPQLSVGFNDTAAYFVGKSIGRNKLIAISPNKTWEGFIGGLVCNIFTTWFFSGYML